MEECPRFAAFPDRHHWFGAADPAVLRTLQRYTTAVSGSIALKLQAIRFKAAEE